VTPFSGSYSPEDVIFLLKPMTLAMVDIADKERLIQSGAHHYSELLSPEQMPGPSYLQLFEALTARYAQRLAAEIMALARFLIKTRPRQITVVSLARAGTPIGALLIRALRILGQTDACHYSISIIRDRGIDQNALAFILHHKQREPAGLVFVDGWTAKGVIAGELRQALRDWNTRQPERLNESLYVVSDIGGVADVAATDDDYAIPSGILNATVSGLTSRSVLNAEIGPDDFHGCVFYEEFQPQDRSQWFLDQVSAHFIELIPVTDSLSLYSSYPRKQSGSLDSRIRGNDDQKCANLPRMGIISKPIYSNSDQRLERRQAMLDFLARIHKNYRISNQNFIKPGVAEATRVLLRRLPNLLLLRDPEHPDVEHLQWLAREKKIPVIIDSTMPIQAAALIKDLL
jgi:hypothetical protein